MRSCMRSSAFTETHQRTALAAATRIGVNTMANSRSRIAVLRPGHLARLDPTVYALPAKSPVAPDPDRRQALTFEQAIDAALMQVQVLSDLANGHHLIFHYDSPYAASSLRL